MKKNSNYDKSIVFNGKFFKTYILKQNEKNEIDTISKDNPYKKKIEGKIVFFKQHEYNSDKKFFYEKPYKTLFNNYCSDTKKCRYPTISTNSETNINDTSEKTRFNINEIESNYGINNARKQTKRSNQKQIFKTELKKIKLKESFKTISYFKNSELYY